MKFFPIAFMIVWDNPKGYEFPNLNSFDNFMNIVGDEEVEMPINLTKVPHERWPEAPENHSFLGFNSELAVGAIDRPKKK
jgi:hypothetical protein